jgi:hypothetical protein
MIKTVFFFLGMGMGGVTDLDGIASGLLGEPAAGVEGGVVDCCARRWAASARVSSEGLGDPVPAAAAARDALSPNPAMRNNFLCIFYPFIE